MKFGPVIPFPQIRALVAVNQQPRLCTVVGWLGHSRCVVVLDGPRQGRKEVDRRDLARYALPDPSKTAQERQQAAQASAGYLTLADLSITLPLLSCAFLAPLAQALRVDFMLRRGQGSSAASFSCG